MKRSLRERRERAEQRLREWGIDPKNYATNPRNDWKARAEMLWVIHGLTIIPVIAYKAYTKRMYWVPSLWVHCELTLGRNIFKTVDEAFTSLIEGLQKSGAPLDKVLTARENWNGFK